MRSFIAGHGLVLFVVCTWNLYFDIWPTISSEGPSWNRMESVRLPLVIVVGPMLAAMSTATMIQHWRPRKLFDHSIRRPIAAFCLGVLAAVAALAVLPIAITLGRLDEILGDAVLMAVCSAWATFIFLLAFTRRRQSGLCFTCDYDIRGSLSTGRCPECGTVI